MKDSNRKAMFFWFGKKRTTVNPNDIAKLKENNKTSQHYYISHLTPFENFKIAKGESAGEVYQHIFGTNAVTPEQMRKAKKALIEQSKSDGITKSNAQKYLREL